MPSYPFENEDGDQRDFTFSMAEVPSIGATIERDGQAWTRLHSDSQVSAGVASIVHGYPYTSIQGCANAPGAKHTREGYSIITSRRHEREWCAMNDRVRD